MPTRASTGRAPAFPRKETEIETTGQATRLPESRLYTFIDEPREFALYFLEGQKLIHDLALVHPVRGRGFAYFRDVVLSIQPMMALLKHDEQFGFYIDSEDPYLRLKIETGHHGTTRCMILPEEFREFPEEMHGIVRVIKLFPNNRAPYESVLQVEGLPLRSIVNRVLHESYQVNSAVVMSQWSDQSLMLHQLPPIASKDEYDYSQRAVIARREGIEGEADRIFSQALHEPDAVQAAFAEIGFRLLASRPVAFRCSCSHERMIYNLQITCGGDHDQLFDPGQQLLEIRCEYCKSEYRISRTDLEHAQTPLQ
jgi:molecular chaperone Hsp33